ncbi:MAG: ABC transporter ATP-binding protein [Acidimicrobiales bacterium]|nr:ABC transporter ATP-binding protein [Acidimicrobiales bacterium]
MNVDHEPTSVLRRGARLLARYVRMHPRPFGVALIGAVIFSGALVGGTRVLGWVTDDLIVPAVRDGEVGFSTVMAAVGAVVAMAMLRSLGVVIRRYFAAMTTYRTQASLRRQVTDTYLDVPLAYHLDHPTGELLAHADADVEAATEVLVPLPFTTGVLVLIAFSVASLALIDPLIMGIGLLVFPMLTILNRVYTARVEQPSAMVQHRIGEVSNVAHESFDGALVVKTLGREDAEIERMAEASDRLREARIDVGRLRAVFEPSIDAIPAVGTVALLVAGAWRLADGAISPGDLVAAMALFGVLAFPMRVMGFFLEELPRSVVSLERIDGVLAARADLDEHPGGTAPLPDTPLAVDVEHLTFTYPGVADQPALDDVSVHVDPGEIVALVGATGGGKSTFCQLLVHLVEPDRGTIRLGGIDLADADPGALRDAVAIVFQESFLFAESITANIAMSTDAGDDEVLEAARIAQADGFVAEMPQGFDTVVGERGVSLSGGQRQRVALARALVRRPRLLVLDDATSAVDPVVEARILDGLRDALGTTTVVVAHRISTIELADRVIYLDGGRVVATGTHAQLLDHPGYERLVSAYEDEAMR